MDNISFTKARFLKGQNIRIRSALALAEKEATTVDRLLGREKNPTIPAIFCNKPLVFVLRYLIMDGRTFAKKVGIASATVSRAVRLHDLTISVAAKIAAALGFSVYETIIIILTKPAVITADELKQRLSRNTMSIEQKAEMLNVARRTLNRYAFGLLPIPLGLKEQLDISVF